MNNLLFRGILICSETFFVEDSVRILAAGILINEIA